MLGKIESRRRRGRGWDGWGYHQLDGHKFEQVLGVGDGQGSLACCSPWDHEKSDTSGRLNWISQANELENYFNSFGEGTDFQELGHCLLFGWRLALFWSVYILSLAYVIHLKVVPSYPFPPILVLDMYDLTWLPWYLSLWRIHLQWRILSNKGQKWYGPNRSRRY